MPGHFPGRENQSVWTLFRLLLDVSLLKPIVRPITRLIVSFAAVPVFRAFLKKVLRVDSLDDELEKDLEQWFRGALILLIATQNMESVLFPWVKPIIQTRIEQPLEGSAEESMPSLEVTERDFGWVLLGLRVMLAIGVIQMMPDQELFAVIHSRPPKLDFARGDPWWPQIKSQAWPYFNGHLCVHLNKSSPVLAILAAIAPGWPGWICYAAALVQYLIIGLVTTRDKALNVLTLFDQEIQRQREALIQEFHLDAEAAESDGAVVPQFALVGADAKSA